MIRVKSMILIASLILLLSGAAESWNNVTNQNYMVCKPISEPVAPNPTFNCSSPVKMGPRGKRGPRGPRGKPGNSPFPADFDISLFAEMETRLEELEETNEALEGTVRQLEMKNEAQTTKITSLERTVQQIEGNNEAQTTKITSLEGTVRQLEGNNEVQTTKITSLEGTVRQMEGNNEAQTTKITSLEGTVRQMEGNNEAQTTKITSLEGTVRQLQGNNEAQTTKITSLEGTVRQLEQTVERLERAATECQFNYIVTATAQSWQESRTLCQAMGGDLAVHGMKNYARRREILTQLNVLDLDRFWIGLSDLTTDGVWRWLDGSLVDRSSSAGWNSGEPNGGRSENCGEIVLGSRGRLNDNVCRTGYKAICEVKYPRGCTP